MRDFFLRIGKRILTPFFLVLLLFGINLAAISRFYLLGAFLLGNLSALIYIFLQGNRIKTSENKSKRAAKLNMLVGLLLRLLFVFLVLAVAAKIDVFVFALVALGFLTFYLIFYFVCIVENYENLKNNRNF